MINWFIITICFILWIEGENILNKWILSHDKSYNFLTTKNKKIFKNKHRTKEQQLEYINNKSEINKYGGSFWFRFIFNFIIIFIMYINIKDNINYFIVWLFGITMIFVPTLFSKNKIYFYLKEFFLISFIFIYLILLPFYIFNFNVTLFFMLPIFLIIKILYNNVRKKWL